MSWSTSELRVRLVLWNRFKPPSKIFYRRFQGDTSFVDLLCFFLSCVCYAFVRVCLFVPCGHQWERAYLLVLICGVKLLVCHFTVWYPGSGVLLECIDSWSLHPYLTYFFLSCTITLKLASKWTVSDTFCVWCDPANKRHKFM